MIGVSINPVLKSYLSDNGYPDIDIYPLNGYSDSVAPFMTWVEFPTTRSSEQFWLRQSSLIYYIYDNDLSRSRNISKIVEKYLNIGDAVGDIKTDLVGTTPDYKICWSRMSSGGMFPPINREGYTCITRSFEIGYIEN